MKPRIGIVPGLVLLAGMTAGCASDLQNAAERGDLQGVKTLLDQGAGANRQHLSDAFVSGAGKGQLKVAEMLLEKGADLETHGDCDPWRGFPNMTALMCAAGHGQGRMVQFLLDRGANVNAKWTEGSFPNWTALSFAGYFGQGQVAKLLVDRGVEDVSGPLKAMRQWGKDEMHPEIVRLLEQAEARQLGTAPAVATAPAPAPAPAPSPTTFAPAPVATIPTNDVDIPPARRVKPKPHAYAVVIGIEQYRQNLPKADFAARDAQTTRDYLTKVMGYQDENVAILLNDRATKGDVEKYIEHWLPNRVEKDASVFIYFSGHGAPNPKTGDAYLVPYDGDPAFVEATGYSLKRLYDHLGKLPAKEVVVMLDSCFSGAGGRSVIGKGMRPMVLTMENQFLAGGKTVVLSASSGAQVSSTYDQKGHGLLTYYFLKGLQGEADTNKDGKIDLAELFDYVKPQVERTARRDFNNDQQPQLFGNPELLTRGIRLVERAP
jgi:hypothetical protein